MADTHRNKSKSLRTTIVCLDGPVCSPAADGTEHFGTETQGPQ